MSAPARIPAAVVNGAGYGGVELLRLLRRHPVFDLVEVTARSDAGKPIAAVFPQLPDIELRFQERVESAEVVFVALPDDASVELIPGLLAEGRRVLDLSAGFRLHDRALYPIWYGYEHPAPALLEEALYGLPEWQRDRLASARLVACPGCYPTAALLGIGPALAADLIEPNIIIDAKSGVSGAGRTLKMNYHYGEANEDVTAYGLTGHRHLPEIEQALAETPAAGRAVPRATFIPHLIPMTRGILATTYATLRSGVTAEAVQDVYHAAYSDTPFVKLTATPPHTKWTYGSNLAFVHPYVEERSCRLIVISAIDNLVKGAAGQAVQNANIMYGLDETAGLPLEGIYP